MGKILENVTYLKMDFKSSLIVLAVKFQSIKDAMKE